MSLDEKPAMYLVTGATGFVGSRFCQRLNLAGRLRVRALVRSRKKAASLLGAKVEIIRGDLLNPECASRAVKGCDVVVHLAHGAEAATATHNLVEASCRAGVQRFVHISSMVVHGSIPDPEAYRDSVVSTAGNLNSYRASKVEQEKIVRQAMDPGALRGVILRPTLVYGPKGPFVTRVLEEARTGIVTIIDDGAGLCNAIFVDDVCDAIEAALVSTVALGQTICINADKVVTWREFTLTFANMIQPPPQVNNISSAEAYAWWAAHPPPPPLPRRSLLRRVVRKAVRMVSPKPPRSPFPEPGRIWRESGQLEFANDESKRLLGWAPKMDFSGGAAEVRKWLERGGTRRRP